MCRTLIIWLNVVRICYSVKALVSAWFVMAEQHQGHTNNLTNRRHKEPLDSVMYIGSALLLIGLPCHVAAIYGAHKHALPYIYINVGYVLLHLTTSIYIIQWISMDLLLLFPGRKPNQNTALVFLALYLMVTFAFLYPHIHFIRDQEKKTKDRMSEMEAIKADIFDCIDGKI
jgi:hypothetical protein